MAGMVELGVPISLDRVAVHPSGVVVRERVGTLMPERSHKYFKLKLWASENAAISAHVSLNMSRKSLAAGASPQTPTGGLISPRPLIFKRRGQRLRAPMTVL